MTAPLDELMDISDFMVHGEKLRLAMAILNEVDLDGLEKYAQHVDVFSQLLAPESYRMFGGARNIDDLLRTVSLIKEPQRLWRSTLPRRDR